jgi:hypothetical protein
LEVLSIVGKRAHDCPRAHKNRTTYDQYGQ